MRTQWKKKFVALAVMLLEFLARESQLFSFLTRHRLYERKKIPYVHVESTGIKLFETTKICIVPLEARVQQGYSMVVVLYSLSFV